MYAVSYTIRTGNEDYQCLFLQESDSLRSALESITGDPTTVTEYEENGYVEFEGGNGTNAVTNITVTCLTDTEETVLRKFHSCGI